MNKTNKVDPSVLHKTGKFTLSSHARERIRQRLGLTTDSAAIAWVKDAVKNSIETRNQGHKLVYVTDLYEIVLDGMKVISVVPTDQANPYLTKLNDELTKRVTKLLTEWKRELRKAEIAVAEAQLSYLKAKSPKVKDVIQRKMTEAVEWRASVENELNNIKYAGKRYGVEV